MDFSGISNPQLVALARELVKEAIKRNPTIGAATQAAMMSEGEILKLRRDELEGQMDEARRDMKEKIRFEISEVVAKRVELETELKVKKETVKEQAAIRMMQAE